MLYRGLSLAAAGGGKVRHYVVQDADGAARVYRQLTAATGAVTADRAGTLPFEPESNLARYRVASDAYEDFNRHCDVIH